MAHGHEDFGDAAPKSTIYALTDLGELAARLGSIVSFDRRGDVFHLRNFDGYRGNWNVSGLGVGVGSTPSAYTSLYGMASLKVNTGNATGNKTTLETNYPIPPLSKIGYELAVSHDDDISELLWQINLYTGEGNYSARYRYLPPTDALDIYNNGAWVNLGSLTMREDWLSFNIWKLVVDYTTGKYIRLLVNNTEYDVSAYSPQYGAGVSAPYVNYAFSMTTGVDVSLATYVDYFIMTHNEP